MSPAIQRATAGTTPVPARVAAAKGMLPMGPAELCMALYQLALDVDGNVRKAAIQTATELPDNIFENAFAARLDPRVFDFFAQHLAPRPALIEKILLNQSTAPETVAAIASTANESLCELIAVNEERLLRHPAIIEALYLNRDARMSTVDRLIELAVRHDLQLELPAYAEMKAALLGQQQAAPAAVDVHASQTRVVAQVGGGDLDRLFDETLGFGEEFAQITDEDSEDLESKLSGKAEAKVQRIEELPVNAKIRLAMLGNMFHRSVLIRDTNKVVSMAAISSPSVSDGEAVKYAGFRGVSGEIIAYISSNKDWQRLYAVKKNLCFNPKCPLRTSMKLLLHLRSPDLRILAKSRDVPSALCTAAKRLIQERQQ